eukprot:TRINITY_DN83531_c0_g1_i1.p1 TRINITY_DN83531_c0_g1~~TRINITY_DN83531_c0_g1_i1.p1  ORF type:complete len:626 (-),score=168.44 TRINITY_DN83531_c0_g1_i1:153-2030(-)
MACRVAARLTLGALLATAPLDAERVTDLSKVLGLDSPASSLSAGQPSASSAGLPSGAASALETVARTVHVREAVAGAAAGRASEKMNTDRTSEPGGGGGGKDETVSEEEVGSAKPHYDAAAEENTDSASGGSTEDDEGNSQGRTMSEEVATAEPGEGGAGLLEKKASASETPPQSQLLDSAGVKVDIWVARSGLSCSEVQKYAPPSASKVGTYLKSAFSKTAFDPRLSPLGIEKTKLVSLLKGDNDMLKDFNPAIIFVAHDAPEMATASLLLEPQTPVYPVTSLSLEKGGSGWHQEEGLPEQIQHKAPEAQTLKVDYYYDNIAAATSSLNAKSWDSFIKFLGEQFLPLQKNLKDGVQILAVTSGSVMGQIKDCKYDAKEPLPNQIMKMSYTFTAARKGGEEGVGNVTHYYALEPTSEEGSCEVVVKGIDFLGHLKDSEDKGEEAVDAESKLHPKAKLLPGKNEEVISEYYCEVDFAGCPAKFETWSDRIKQIETTDLKNAAAALKSAENTLKSKAEARKKAQENIKTAGTEKNFWNKLTAGHFSKTQDQIQADIDKLNAEMPGYAEAVEKAKADETAVHEELQKAKDEKLRICGASDGEAADGEAAGIVEHPAAVEGSTSEVAEP